jgi:hypothetical protein
MVDGRRGERELRRFFFLVAEQWRSQVDRAQEHGTEEQRAEVHCSQEHSAQKHCREKARSKPREIVGCERKQIVVAALQRCSEEAAPFHRATFDVAFARHWRPQRRRRHEWRRRSGRERLGGAILEL